MKNYPVLWCSAPSYKEILVTCRVNQFLILLA